MKTIDFWFSIGSTYTYLSVMRLSDVATRYDLSIRWRPFSVRAIMQEAGYTPFVGKPTKMAYMWRDIERRAARYDLAPKLPAPYPLEQFDRANRVAILAAQEGWCENYVRATYRYWFEHGLEAGNDANLEAALSDCEQSADRVLESAGAEACQAAYEAATGTAKSLGIFGSPSFIVNGSELFWGDDRLEDAIDWINSQPA